MAPDELSARPQLAAEGARGIVRCEGSCLRKSAPRSLTAHKRTVSTGEPRAVALSATRSGTVWPKPTDGAPATATTTVAACAAANAAAANARWYQL